MKYKEIELEPITEPQVFAQPKWMLVSHFYDEEATERLVLAIVRNKKGCVYAIAEEPNGDIMKWAYCAEPPKEEPNLATYRQLAKWLAEGKGEMTYINSDVVYSHLGYAICVEDSTANKMQVRKWGDKEWHEPTREYLGLEDK